MSGRLYVVATPIGEVDDLSPRARSVLGRVPLIAAEDTRVVRTLLGQLGIAVPQLWSCHDHNEAQRAGPVVERLLAGDDVALVSDAGTPLVSDPGFRVVGAVLEAGIEVVPIPGPSAPMAALVASGLPTDRFLFAGFPPSKSAKRRRFYAELAGQSATLVLFESPHRIVASLEDAAAELGPDRPCCLAISLTKAWERFHRGDVASVREALVAQPDEVIGEMTLVVGGAEATSDEDPRAWAVVDALAAAGVAPSVIRDSVAPVLGLGRRDVYQRALRAVTG